MADNCRQCENFLPAPLHKFTRCFVELRGLPEGWGKEGLEGYKFSRNKCLVFHTKESQHCSHFLGWMEPLWRHCKQHVQASEFKKMSCSDLFTKKCGSAKREVLRGEKHLLVGMIGDFTANTSDHFAFCFYIYLWKKDGWSARQKCLVEKDTDAFKSHFAFQEWM